MRFMVWIASTLSDSIMFGLKPLRIVHERYHNTSEPIIVRLSPIDDAKKDIHECTSEPTIVRLSYFLIVRLRPASQLPIGVLLPQIGPDPLDGNLFLYWSFSSCTSDSITLELRLASAKPIRCWLFIRTSCTYESYESWAELIHDWFPIPSY